MLIENLLKIDRVLREKKIGRCIFSNFFIFDKEIKF